MTEALPKFHANFNIFLLRFFIIRRPTRNISALLVFYVDFPFIRCCSSSIVLHFDMTILLRSFS